MTVLPPSTQYTDKFVGFNQRSLEYIHNTKYYTYNVLEGAVRSSKTVLNIYAAGMAIEESKDRIHFAVGYNSKVAIRNIFESDGLGLMYLPQWQGRLSTKALGPGTFILVLHSPYGSVMPEKEIVPVGGGEVDSEASFRGMSVGIVVITEANLMHPATLDALEQRTFKADIRRFFIDFNPSSPANFLYVWLGKRIGKEVLPLHAGTLHPVGYNKGGFRVLQYLHMTFVDNLSLKPERIAEILAISDPDSTEHQRMILGLRASGAGKMYNVRAKNIFDGQIQRFRYSRWLIVTDPGVSISETAFVAIALTNDREPEVHVFADWSHTNKEDKVEKTDLDYAYDFFGFIKMCEKTMGFQPFKVVVDPAAVSFIREYNKHAKLNQIMYPLSPGIKREIDQRIRQDQALLYSGRLKFHKNSAVKTRFEFEDAEYDEKKSLKGLYERLDAPHLGKQIGLIDCVEMGLEHFVHYLFASGTMMPTYEPDRKANLYQHF